MQYRVLTRRARNLARGAAVVILAAAAAGCSSDVLRFEDAISTGSTQNQRDIIAPGVAQQPFPGQTAGVDGMSTGSVQGRGVRRSDLLAGPVNRPQPNGAVGQGGYQPAPVQQAAVPVSQQPFPTAPAHQQVVRQPMPAVDRTVTGSTQRPLAPAQAAIQSPQMPTAPARQAQPTQDVHDGWSRAGGTQITVRQGETVYNLSRRFGVPVNAILHANGLSDANALAAGQNVVIPTYVYSRNAPNSMPDSNPKVADARSSTGTRQDVDPSRVPAPIQSPTERVAVLPSVPRPSEPQAATASDATAPGATNGANVYTVASGDTLSAVARKTGTTTAALKQANGLDGGILRIGQKLVIPAVGQNVAAAPAPARPQLDQTTTGTTRPAPAETAQAKPADKVMQEAALDTSPAPDATGIGRMRWPARGRVVSGFGASAGGKRNDGIDISVPEGTPVKAAENGVVIYAGDGLKEFGNTVLVRHENGLVTVYGHASELKVKRGDTVRRGQDIASSGMSGSADQPKLHFEVRKDSTPVDPSKFLE